MDKVKGKKDGKKGDRPASCADILDESSEEPQKRSATMPASSNVRKVSDTKNKAKTLDVDELSRDDSKDKTDGKILLQHYYQVAHTKNQHKKCMLRLSIQFLDHYH